MCDVGNNYLTPAMFAVLGGSVGALVLLVILVVVIAFIIRVRRRRRKQTPGE